MTLNTLLKLSLAVGFLTPGYVLLSATNCSAEPVTAPVAKQETVTTNTVSTVQKTTEKTTEKTATDVVLDPASQRVDQAKIKLEQARSQLSAAKAMLRAAEAEFRAAKADREALSARNEAMKLADASGLKDDGVQPVQPQAAITFGQNRLYPATVAPATPVTPSADLSSTRIQQGDFNAPQKDDAAANGADLRPTKSTEEPSQNM